MSSGGLDQYESDNNLIKEILRNTEISRISVRIFNRMIPAEVNYQREKFKKSNAEIYKMLFDAWQSMKDGEDLDTYFFKILCWCYDDFIKLESVQTIFKDNTRSEELKSKLFEVLLLGYMKKLFN